MEGVTRQLNEILCIYKDIYNMLLLGDGVLNISKMEKRENIYKRIHSKKYLTGLNFITS